MKFEWLRDNEVVVSKTATGLCAVLVVLLFVKLIGIGAYSVRVNRWGEAAAGQGGLSEEDRKKYLSQYADIAASVKKHNLFAPPPGNKHPVKAVDGIIGDEVLINHKWYKVGDKVGDANIVAIAPTFVTIEWKGKQKDFAPMATVSELNDVQSAQEKVPKKGHGRHKERPAAEPRAKMKRAVAVEDPLAWMGVELSPGLRAKLLEQWNNATDEQKQKMKDEWNNMSDEEKEQAISALEEHS